MTEQSDAASAVFTIRLATVGDLAGIEWLDSFGTSPHRNINRDVAKYFGSVDPSIYERNLIFLAELYPDIPTDLPYPLVGKVELLLAPQDAPADIGYIKRVVVHPAWRSQRIARALLKHVKLVAARDYQVRSLDLHVGEGNVAAIRLYEALGFTERHREIYMRLDLHNAHTTE